jgi:two-component system, response regulator PdtaR
MTERTAARRVVIAEDEAIIRLDLKEILEVEGYEVVGETGRGDAGVVAYLVKPFQRGELVPAIEVAVARFAEYRAIEEEHARLSKEVASLGDQLETRRAVDRAKGILMDQHDMGEAEAFSFVQRSAMDRRVPMRTVAQEIVDGKLRP